MNTGLRSTRCVFSNVVRDNQKILNNGMTRVTHLRIRQRTIMKIKLITNFFTIPYTICIRKDKKIFLKRFINIHGI